MLFWEGGGRGNEEEEKRGGSGWREERTLTKEGLFLGLLHFSETEKDRTWIRGFCFSSIEVGRWFRFLRAKKQAVYLMAPDLCLPYGKCRVIQLGRIWCI